MPSRHLQEELQKLKEIYCKELPQKIAEIEETWHTLDGVEGKKRLHTLVHKLAGGGATLGFYDLSQTAQALALLLKGEID